MTCVEAGEFELVYDPSIGEGEPWYVNDHTFVRNVHGTWHLIGITHAEPAFPHDERHLAHATAPNLHGFWTKQPYATSADESLDETLLWAPHVIPHDDRYWMFVCAGGDDMTAYRLHLATSDDLSVWERHDANPLVVDGYEARDPMVLRVEDRWVMYYTATVTPSGGRHVVAAVESDDLVHWGGRRFVYTDAASGTFGGPTESPFVVERDGRWYLFIGPDWEGFMAAFEATGKYDPVSYRRTRILESDDAFSFRAEDEVGRIDAHAAEVIVDEAGEMWVSHCGWGQGGVYLAPLRFIE
ncbi:MAG TPA: family 43 glycosylhydrolase [Microthrixaceae bacterium]|nr:family 43 glycosylhydrolase [Microthrixaceae bacterium]